MVELYESVLSEPEPLLRPREVAAILSVSTRTLDRLVAAGELRRLRVGGSNRFRASDVRELLERGASP